MDQADPSLTVHDLPVDPQIAFRKNTLTKSEGMEEHDVRFSHDISKIRKQSNFQNKKSTINCINVTFQEKDDDLLSPLRRGMKEEVMERPALDNSPSRFLPSPFSKGTSQG